MSENTTPATASTDVVVSESTNTSQTALLATMKGSASNIMSTISGTDFKSKAQTVAAVQNAEPLEEHLGKQILLSHWVGQAVEFDSKDEKDAEGKPVRVKAVRTILIDVNGKAYSATSTVIPGDLGLLIEAFGEPAGWETPVPVKVVHKGKAPRKFYTIEIDLSAL